MAHISVFYCAGGGCKVTQCIYCLSLTRVQLELAVYERCFHCGMLKDLCACHGRTRAESKLINTP